MEVVFEPNPYKEAVNIRDHGISFATAQEVFADPFQIGSENYFMDGEQRTNPRDDERISAAVCGFRGSQPAG